MSNAVATSGTPLALADYEDIEQAVKESKRGRWFLEEYARRLRRSETTELLHAIGKLEDAVTTSQDALTERLAKALGTIVPALAPGERAAANPLPAPANGHLKYFKQDEEIFEAAPAPPKPAPEPLARHPAPVAKPDVARGAKLIIRRTGEAAPAPLAAEAKAEPPPLELPAADPPVAAPLISLTPPPDAIDAPKGRIVIIRHKPGERIDVPLQHELAASA